MGMAASQVRLLQLTSRKNTIGRTLESLSLEKTSLTREMKNVSKDYQNALSSKTLKWSNNSGATYVDLSYSTLMRPNSYNNNTPYMISDSNGKIVLDSKYRKYAEMISPNGAAGGDWESNRTEILSELTGLSTDEIRASVEADAAVEEAADKVNNLMEEADVLESEEPVKASNAKNFITNAGVISDIDIGDYYSNSSKTLNLGDSTKASGNFKTFLDTLCSNMSKYLSDEDIEAFTSAKDNLYNNYSSLFSCTSEQLANSATGITKSGNDYSLNIRTIVDELLGMYKNAGGSYKQSEQYGDYLYYTRDKESTEWKDWKTSYDAKIAELETAKEEYSEAVDTSNQTMTSANESTINFYDQLFTSIADNGWVCNSQVEDNDYLNQMLQNNQYFITTAKSAINDEGEEYYEYSNNIASNFDNIFSVNDTDAQNEALVEYEYQKSVINEKESRIDQRMQNLETEQSAINEMIKGIESVRNDNTERTFSIFS